MEKLVIPFENIVVEVSKDHEDDKSFENIGKKALDLAKIAKALVLVPRGFVITNNGYRNFTENGGKDISEELWAETMVELRRLEGETYKKFGNVSNPLLLSIRSDSNPYLPHMLDTVVNVGLNDATAIALENLTSDRAFVYSSYCQFIQSYSSSVLNVHSSLFDDMHKRFAESRNLNSNEEFAPVDWVDLCRLYKSIVVRKTGRSFPQDPMEQLKQCIRALFFRQNSAKVHTYEEFYNIEKKNVSIIISEMVSTNIRKGSCSGLLSTFDPSTGETRNVGRYAKMATHQDIIKNWCVSHPIQNIGRDISSIKAPLEAAMDAVKAVFHSEPVLFEFVYDAPKFYITQILPVPFSFNGLMRFIINKKGTDKNKALKYLDFDDVITACLPELVTGDELPFAVGLSAGHGGVIGKAVFSNEECVRMAKKGEKVVLFKKFITASDFNVLTLASAVVTSEGSDWTVGTRLARMLRKTVAIGCKGLEINEQERTATISDKVVKENDVVSVDSTGRVFNAELKLDEGGVNSGDAKKVFEFIDTMKGCNVVNGSEITAEGIAKCKAAGAQGLMALSLEDSVSETLKECAIQFYKENTKESIEPVAQKIIEVLQPLYKEAGTMPLYVKLLDTPVSESIPTERDILIEVTQLRTRKEATPEGEEFPLEEELKQKEEVLDMVRRMKESNPLMGTCGVRMALYWPNLFEAQIRSIFTAAKAENVEPYIIIPGITLAGEIDKINETIKKLAEEMEVKDYHIGAEIDTARGCCCANAIAERVSFIVIDYNKLCQTLFGMSQKDSGDFLSKYKEWKIMDSPFDKFDSVGAASIIKKAVEAAKTTRPNQQIALIGAQAEDPKVISQLAQLGVTSITCNHTLIPIASFCFAKASVGNN